MTKEQLRKNWRRGFAVALTAAMVANSTLPSTTTFAAEFTAPDAEEEISLQENTQTGSEEAAFDDGSQNAENAETAGEDFSSGDEEAVPAKEVQDGDFSQTKTVDGIEVSVTADDGVFPEGASLNVRKVKKQSVIDTFEDAVQKQQETSSDDTMAEEIREELEKLADQGIDDFGVGTGEENDLQVFDITITDENGEEIQPDNSKGTATVSFSGIDTDSTTEDIQIYHADDDLESVQALDTDAYVEAGYAEVPAEHFSYYCLSILKPGTQFEIHELISAYANTELTTGIYYVSDNTPEFVGADSTSSSNAGGNGLKIASGATVYIYVPENETLTAKGGNGKDATNGANGKDGDITTKSSSKAAGLTFSFPEKAQQAAGGTGGTGATGGGAGILVPANSKLVCIGQGNIKATGGNGGNAGNGGVGGKTHVRYQSSYTAYNSSNTVYTDYNTYAGNICKISVTGTATKEYAAKMNREAPGAGGGAGGGAAGGGAGIGSNGASGNTGVAGANSSATGSKNYDFTKNSASDSNKYSTQNKIAGSAGSIYINCNYNATGGNGGTAGSQGAASELISGTYQTYYSGNIDGTLYTHTFYFMDGQGGGGGAAGGNGAKIGTGGAGGISGMGGDSGSSTTSESGNSKSYCTSKIGANGTTKGSNGSGSSQNLSDDQNPYNTVTFTGASSNGTQKYYLAKESVITAPSSNVSGFFGWKVTTGAASLDAFFGSHTTNSLLTGDTKIYKAGETIKVDKLANGNVVLEAVVHSHSWKYESNENEIKVYCAGENGEGVCDHYGAENAVTLTLKADSKTYDGTGASVSVENADTIQNLTSESATVVYYKADADGTITDQAGFKDAPTNAGNYLATVTLGKVRAEQKFTISPFEIKEDNVTLNQDSFEWTGTEISPVVTIQVTLKAGKQNLTADKDYTVTGTLTATDLSGTDGYTLTVSGTGNFTGSVEKTWKITKKVMTGISATPVEATYDGTSHGITVTGQPDGAEVTYSADGKIYSAEQPVCKDVKAGGYTVYYKVTKDSYEDYTGSTTVTINPRPVTVTVADKEITYGDVEPEFTSEIIDGKLVEGDDLELTYSREEGTAAKNYEITVTSKNNNYNITVEPGTLTIKKKDLTISPEADQKKVYGDADPKFQYSVSGLVNDEKADDILTGTLTRTKGENKGTYAYEIGSLTDASGNYNVTLDQNTAKFTITAKEVALTWSKTDLTYNGAEQSVTAQVSNPAFDSDTFTLEYTGNTAANAGNYKAEVTALGNDNYVLTENSNQKTDWSIAKAETTVSQAPKVISSLTYTGEEQDLISAGQTEDGTFVYKVNGGEWSETIPSGLDAGTYEISYKVKGDDNHNDSAEGKLTVSIAKKAVVVSDITAEDKTYDGNTSAVLNFEKVKFVGIVGEDSLNVTASGVFEDKNAGQKKVLISNLKLGGTSADNYVLAKDEQQTETTAAIKSKEITATITPNGGIYEGTITPATAVLTGLVGNEKPEVTLTYTGTANDGTKADRSMPTHAGTYTVTASITDSNYNLKAEGASAEFVVAKADPALTVSAVADKNYGDEAFKLEISNKGDGQKSYISGNEKVATVDKDGIVTIVGAGKATLTVSIAESANYKAGEKTVTVTVKKVDHKLVVEKMAYEVTYGDPTFKIAASAGDKETDIKFTSNKKDVASVDADGTVTVGNVGTAKITVSMDESQNYLTVAKEVTVTVVPEKVTVTPDKLNKHVGMKDPEKFTYQVSKHNGKDSLKGITLTRKEGEEPGTYEITATVDKNEPNSNYKITLNKGTFTINGHDWSGEWKTVREATSWSEGKKEKTCAFDGCDQKKYETIPKTGEKEDPNDKKLEKDAEVAPGAPIDQASLDSSKSELLEAPKIFTDVEKEAISAGNVKAWVWIEVTPVNMDTDLTDADKTAIKKEAEKLTGKDSEIVYFNADMFKKVGNGNKEPITDPGVKIKITIRIPDELLNHQSNTVRDYKIIRMHKGTAEVLSGTFNSTTKEFTFETDKFSTYAISYKDTYYAPSYPVTDVVMSQDKATLTKEGETLQLTADVKPSYADNKNVTWKSSDEKVATVDKNGKVTAVANGIVTITATSADGKHTATATITVKIAPEKLTVTADKKTLTKIGDSLPITAKVEPDNAYKKLIWKSSDEKVAIVDSDGKVTAVGTGTATITVTTEDGKLSETVTITVKIPDEPTVNETTGYGRLKARSVTQTNNSIKLEWTRVSGADGYIIYGNYCNGNGKTYKYNKITTITNGKTRTWTHTKLKKETYYKYIVKAYKLVDGKKVITDTSVSVHATTTGGKYGVAKAVSITKIGSKKNVTNVTLKRSKTAQITAKEIKKDRPIRHHRNICYESSNTKVATVTPDGMIQATGKGTCTIWVYAQNGVYKAVTVTVK